MSNESFELEEISDELLAAIQPQPYGQDDAESDFIFNVQLSLAKALVHRMETHGTTRSKIAKLLHLDKSTVSRMLADNANLTARSIAALCFAMDAEPKFSIDFHDARTGNYPAAGATPTSQMVNVYGTAKENYAIVRSPLPERLALGNPVRTGRAENTYTASPPATNLVSAP